MSNPWPSQGLQNILNTYETSLRKNALKDAEPPEWHIMAAALWLAYQTFEKSHELNVMFDVSNPFDLSLLTICVEAERPKKTAPITKAQSEPDPNRN